MCGALNNLSPRIDCGVWSEAGLMVQMDRQTPQQVRGDGSEFGMRLRKKNLDYEILRALVDRPKALLHDDIPQISLAKFAKYFHFEEYDVQERVKFLEVDQLITKSEGAEKCWLLNSIKPEGRLLYERMNNNRWQRRLIDWLIGGAATIVFGSLLAFVIYISGFNN